MSRETVHATVGAVSGCIIALFSIASCPLFYIPSGILKHQAYGALYLLHSSVLPMHESIHARIAPNKSNMKGNIGNIRAKKP